MRVGELFAGVGGMAMGFRAAGWDTAWLAEIGDRQQAVLEHRWPEVPKLWDVTTLDGAQLVAEHGPIDCLAGGSPCQGLSGAGKGKGLEDPRSALFHHQMRLWDETGAPFCLWENVYGALKSNGGRDFAAVLSAYVGADVPVPTDRKGKRRPWPRAGRVLGPSGVAAWRILDARYFGVAQRRDRVFVLGSRVAGIDPAAVLLEPEGHDWGPPPRIEARTGTSADPQAVARIGVGFHSTGQGWWNESGDTMGTLRARERMDDTAIVLAIDGARGSEAADVAPPIRAQGGAKQNGGARIIVAYDLQQITHPENRSNPRPGDPAPALSSRGEGLIAVCMAHGQANAEVMEDLAPTLTLLHEAPIVANTLVGNGKQFQADTGTYVGTLGKPRRLTPRECERLMGWPDDWTLVEYRGKLLSDAARYRACGNGVVRQCAQWIAARLAFVISSSPPSR
jgi:DNA (cytosine-5)-methyltransferase 1